MSSWRQTYRPITRFGRHILTLILSPHPTNHNRNRRPTLTLLRHLLPNVTLSNLTYLVSAFR